MPTDKPPPPHTYKLQRQYERDAAENRERLLKEGCTLPPVCGYTYLPKKRAIQAGQVIAPVICMRVGGAGTDHHGKGFCDYHDWMAETHISTGPKQLQAARIEAARQSGFFGVYRDTDPYAEILNDIARTAQIVRWIEGKMEELRQQGLDDGNIVSQYNFKTGFTPSVWMDLHARERKHLIDTCVAAIKAGIAERKVQIAEQQGQLIAAMMMAFIHDPELGLSPNQVMRAPELIRKHMLALPRGQEPRNETEDLQEIINVQSREV